MSPPASSEIPGARLLAVWPALAAGVLAFNVYYLRRSHPGVLSGKLSDLTINFLLPILLFSAMEWGWFLWRSLRRRPFRPLGTRSALAACGVSAAYFTLLKTIPGFTPWHVGLLHCMAAPLGVDAAFRNIADPTDLLTLVATPLAARYLLARRHGGEKPATPLTEHDGRTACGKGCARPVMDLGRGPTGEGR